MHRFYVLALFIVCITMLLHPLVAAQRVVVCEEAYEET